MLKERWELEGGAARGEEGEFSNTVPLEELVENRVVIYKCNYSIKYQYMFLQFFIIYFL